MRLAAPPLVEALAERVHAAGGRALLVGGCVRDALLDQPVKDWDVEVYGLPEAELVPLLRRLGPVNAVGKSFGVYKLGPGNHLDVSLPRRDSNAGPGHRGIAVEGDPTMSPREAARRRDLTVNAILYDPRSHEVIDPWGGADDLAARRLRAVDPDTFLEDPLRALRVVQFAARLEFSVDPELVALCREAPLHELPAERILGEWEKLLLRARRPSIGLAVARTTRVLERVFPEAAACDDPTRDATLDGRTPGPMSPRDDGEQLVVQLALWLWRCPLSAVEATLDRLGLHRVGQTHVRRRLLEVHAAREAPLEDDPALRHLSTRVHLRLLLCARAARADEHAPHAQRRALALGILDAAPEPLVHGRDLIALGHAPGPALGTLLAAVYAAQLDGTLHARTEALDWIARRVAEAD